jgi:hypothetical protein
MLDDHRPDPDDTADLELPDQQALIDAFTVGLCKESQHDFHSLSTLVVTLPDPSLSHGYVKAKNETVQACHEIQVDSGRIDFHNQFDQVNRQGRRRQRRSAQACGSSTKGHFTSHNLRESDLDGDQDLSLWLRSLEDVLREVLGDDILTMAYI